VAAFSGAAAPLSFVITQRRISSSSLRAAPTEAGGIFQVPPGGVLLGEKRRQNATEFFGDLVEAFMGVELNRTLLGVLTLTLYDRSRRLSLCSIARSRMTGSPERMSWLSSLSFSSSLTKSSGEVQPSPSAIAISVFTAFGERLACGFGEPSYDQDVVHEKANERLCSSSSGLPCAAKTRVCLGTS
jgi:hypothetical protein